MGYAGGLGLGVQGVGLGVQGVGFRAIPRAQRSLETLSDAAF